MGRPFFRQLRATLAPGGVLAVNYFGGRGMGLKQAYCRLRLEFESGARLTAAAAADWGARRLRGCLQRCRRLPTTGCPG